MGENEDSRATDSSGFPILFPCFLMDCVVAIGQVGQGPFTPKSKTRLKSFIFCQVNKPVIRVNSSPSNSYWSPRL